MIGRVASEAARRFGDRTAYVTPAGWSVSYRDLDRLSDEVAVGLTSLGIGEGDVVSLVLPSIPEHVVAYLAAAKVGAVTAAVNARLAAPERAAVLDLAGPRLVLATGDLLDGVPTGDAEVVTVTPAEHADGVLSDLRVADDAPRPLPEDPDRPVAIVFTSGTTGTPKGAVFGGRQLAHVTLVDTGNRWGDGGVTLAGTSLAHLGPTTKLPGKLHQGGVTHLMERWRAADALALVSEHRMSMLGGIPTQVALMLRQPDFDAYDLSSVKVVVVGGGPATPALVREARARLGCPVLIRYSCTEAGIGTGTALDDPPEDSEETVGRALTGVTVTIRDADGAELPSGEEGEVCLASPAVASGYWEAPEATRATFLPGGGVRTGDLGWIDDRGRLHLVGRSKEMYVRGGYNVHPAEVEAVLAAHPDVGDVAVVPRADDVMGEIGVAVVVPRRPHEPPSLEALRDHAAGRLARYK
ncbi:MAG TPA: class I adenylate-forming enzyme family protein, partial [Acidimicrobiia bacterium]|nr:class I adenylate-forming enzyme family protein [Acidimicrobiia bacterium]